MTTQPGNKKTHISLLFHILMSFLVGVLMVACGSDQKSKVVMDTSKNRPKKMVPSQDGGFNSAGYTILSTLAVKEVFKIMDIAANGQKSSYVDPNCMNVVSTGSSGNEVLSIKAGPSTQSPCRNYPWSVDQTFNVTSSTGAAGAKKITRIVRPPNTSTSSNSNNNAADITNDEIQYDSTQGASETSLGLTEGKVEITLDNSSGLYKFVYSADLEFNVNNQGSQTLSNQAAANFDSSSNLDTSSNSYYASAARRPGVPPRPPVRPVRPPSTIVGQSHFDVQGELDLSRHMVKIDSLIFQHQNSLNGKTQVENDMTMTSSNNDHDNSGFMTTTNCDLPIGIFQFNQTITQSSKVLKLTPTVFFSDQGNAVVPSTNQQIRLPSCMNGQQKMTGLDSLLVHVKAGESTLKKWVANGSHSSGGRPWGSRIEFPPRRTNTGVGSTAYPGSYQNGVNQPGGLLGPYAQPGAAAQPMAPAQ